MYNNICKIYACSINEKGKYKMADGTQQQREKPIWYYIYSSFCNHIDHYNNKCVCLEHISNRPSWQETKKREGAKFW